MSAGWLRIDKNAEGGARVFRKVSGTGRIEWHSFSHLLVSMAFILLYTSKCGICSVVYYRSLEIFLPK